MGLFLTKYKERKKYSASKLLLFESQKKLQNFLLFKKWNYTHFQRQQQLRIYLFQMDELKTSKYNQNNFLQNKFSLNFCQMNHRHKTRCYNFFPQSEFAVLCAYTYYWAPIPSHQTGQIKSLKFPFECKFASDALIYSIKIILIKQFVS